MAVVMSDASGGSKWMEVGRSNAVFHDITEHVAEPVRTNAHGWGDFAVMVAQYPFGWKRNDRTQFHRCALINLTLHLEIVKIEYKSSRTGCGSRISSRTRKFSRTDLHGNKMPVIQVSTSRLTKRSPHVSTFEIEG